MKVKKFTFTTIELDAGKEIDTKMVIGGVNYYPTGVRILNTAGVPVELIFLTGAEEEADYIANPTNYIAFPVDDSESYNNDRKLYRTSRFKIMTVAGYNATDSVDVFFLGYKMTGIAVV